VAYSFLKKERLIRRWVTLQIKSVIDLEQEVSIFQQVGFLTRRIQDRSAIYLKYLWKSKESGINCSTGHLKLNVFLGLVFNSHAICSSSSWVTTERSLSWVNTASTERELVLPLSRQGDHGYWPWRESPTIIAASTRPSTLPRLPQTGNQIFPKVRPEAWHKLRCRWFHGSLEVPCHRGTSALEYACYFNFAQQSFNRAPKETPFNQGLVFLSSDWAFLRLLLIASCLVPPAIEGRPWRAYFFFEALRVNSRMIVLVGLSRLLPISLIKGFYAS